MDSARELMWNPVRVEVHIRREHLVGHNVFKCEALTEKF